MERNTRQRTAMLEAIKHAGRPLLPQELLELASKDAPSLSMATVYRALKQFAMQGTVSPVALAGEPLRYEASGHGHHHHFQCLECRRVYDVPGCMGQLSSMVPPGFQLQAHEVTLYGRCATCVQLPAPKRVHRARHAPARQGHSSR